VQRIITELRLEQTRLATLSACESGRVGVKEAEEHVGLLQAVMSAGAQAVVAGLWKVDAAATHALFEYFYDGVADGALRRMRLPTPPNEYGVVRAGSIPTTGQPSRPAVWPTTQTNQNGVPAQ
jgi:hypothetical protein